MSNSCGASIYATTYDTTTTVAMTVTAQVENSGKQHRWKMVESCSGT